MQLLGMTMFGLGAVILAALVACFMFLFALTFRLFMWAVLFQWLAVLFSETWHKWLVLLHVDGAMEPWQFGVGFGLLSWIIRGKAMTLQSKSGTSSETSPTDTPTGRLPKLQRVRNLDL
jgi:hypothetical protein